MTQLTQQDYDLIISVFFSVAPQFLVFGVVLFGYWAILTALH